MSEDPKDKAKKYCYKDDCSIIITGFHLEQYPVCSTCREEVTPSLQKQIEDRNKLDGPLDHPWEGEDTDILNGVGIIPKDFFLS